MTLGLAWVCLICALVAVGAQAPPPRHILILYSFGRDFEPFNDVAPAFRAELARLTPEHIVFDEASLNAERMPTPEDERVFVQFLEARYAAPPPELVVAIGAPAARFYARYRQELYRDAALLVVGVEQRVVQQIPLGANDRVAAIRGDFPKAAENILQLLPETTTLAIIVGSSAFEQFWLKQMQQDLAQLTDRVRLVWLTNLKLEQVLERVAVLGPQSAVLYGLFNTGADGVPYESDQALRAVRAASNAPVFGLIESQLGVGIVGGPLLAMRQSGIEGAQVAERMLRNDTVVGGRLLEIGAPIYDWRELNRWGIRESRLPAGSEVRFRPASLWEQHKPLILSAVSILLLQAALIAALLLERRTRRRTATALTESEKRMELAARAAGLTTWIWDVAHDRIWSTPEAEIRGGEPNDEPRTLDKVLDSVHPADREHVDTAFRRALAENGDFEVEYRMVQPDGEVRWIAARGRAEHASGQRLLGVALDITERKAAELQAAQDRSALRHMTRVATLGQLSASIAHELNQPLAAILGNAEAAHKMLAREPMDLAELREICKDIVAEDHRAVEVIGRLRELFKRGEMRLQSLDLHDLIRDTLHLVHTELLTRQIALVTDLDPSLPLIDGDRVQLQQVLLNLLLNAADAMSGVEPEKRKLTLRTKVIGARVELCVVDCGTGIAVDNIEKVFTPFWSTKPAGMGIGLAVCHSIVAAHGGTLAAANNPGGGATFCVTLPVRGQG